MQVKATAELSMALKDALARRAFAVKLLMVSRGCTVSTVNSRDVCSAKPAPQVTRYW